MAKVDTSGEHHRWLGALNPIRGTGRLKVQGRQVTAHRYAWELEHGELEPGGKVVPCPDEPACVRVDHLRLEGATDAPAPAGTAGRRSRGGGTMRERSPGRWELAVVAGTDERGRPLRSYRTFTGSKPEASRALSMLVAEATAGGPVVRTAPSADLTVSQLIDEYLLHLENDKGRKHSTLVRYRNLKSTWLSAATGARRLNRVTARDIDAVLGSMRQANQSQSSIHQMFTLLNGAFKWARRDRRVLHNPVLEVEEPRSAVRPREISPPEASTVRRLIAAAFELELAFGVACHLGAATGMRRGELCGLRWREVHLTDEAYLVVAATVNDAAGDVVIDHFTKTRRTRRVSLDPRSVHLLKELHSDAEFIADACGTPLHPDAFVFARDVEGLAPCRPHLMTSRMRTLRRKLKLTGADFDATMHALRHWTQTTLNEAGYNPRQVALRGGHSEQLMNRVYVHRTSAAERNMTDFIGELLTRDE